MRAENLVSIIIPTYNRGHLIKETLDSLLSQSYKNWECIIVDDGSSDDTVKVVSDYHKKDSRFKYEHRPDYLPSGGNAARNYGFKKIQGQYVQWFDDDDIMLPEYISDRIDTFKESTKFVIAMGSVTDENLEFIKPMTFDPDNPLFNGIANGRNQLITNSVLFRKTYLLEQDLFDINLKRGQETEFFSRLFFAVDESDYEVVESPLFLYRQHASSKTYKNEGYLPDFKKSEAFVAVENFKRSLDRNDISLRQFLYRVIINFLFRAIEHKDHTNLKYIMEEINPILNRIDRSLARRLRLSVWLLSKSGRSSYRMEMYFKEYKAFI